MSLSPDPAACPFEIARPVMVQRWEQLTFLHWRYDASAVQAVVPDHLEVETFDGSAWVGLVPFLMRVGVPRGGAGDGARWFARFCETNVRTYVRDAQGRSGIWFLSLDAADLSAVVTARTTYRLPYFWSEMSLDAAGDRVDYRCRRRWPGPKRPRSRVAVKIEAPYEPSELTAQDHFLTARFRLFSVTGDRRRTARAAHLPWPLHRATAADVSDELVTAAGLPSPQGDPLVHWSPGVTVRIGRPER